MANTKQAKKRIRSSEKRRQQNMGLRSRTRTAVKNVRAAIEQGNSELAKKAFIETQQKLDKLASKGIIDKKTAARYKSNLNKAIKALAAA